MTWHPDTEGCGPRLFVRKTSSPLLLAPAGRKETEQQWFPQQAVCGCALGPTLGPPQKWCELRAAGPCLGGSRGCSFEDVVSRTHFESDATFLYPCCLGCYLQGQLS